MSEIVATETAPVIRSAGANASDHRQIIPLVLDFVPKTARSAVI